ncbi:MAG: hypothetical protein M1836_001979 [Candelina mexicana]|nr:MAG: hypothetical protein M1836_001979 [Candelina mexicana]
MSESSGPQHEIPPVFRLENAVPDRLVHLIPDELARKVPEHPLFAFPETDTPQDGLVEVSAKCFANAINRTSWYLESLLGKAPQGFPSVGYMGSNDLRYFLFMFGAIKAGYKMLFLSPKNSDAGHLNVLEKADCHIFLTAKHTKFDHVLSQRKMKTATVPELQELLDNTPASVYPYTKSFEQARKDPCLVLHTTGSTGLPKPITWKLEILSTYEAWRMIPPVDGYIPTTEVYQESRRAYNCMPLFHTSGLNTGITMSLLLGVTTVYGSAGVVPHAAYADEMHQLAGIDASIGPPAIYEELVHDPASLERFHSFRYILVCGAPISQQAGDTISEQTRVISNFGATETACLPRLAPAIKDWQYYYWHPTHSGIELRDHKDGLYELFLVRDPKLDLYQGIFSTFPNIQEYSMNDLYSKHPDPAKGFLYKWTSRADDVVVLSNGENLAPALMEASLKSSTAVQGAMVVGHGKFEPAALVDLTYPPPEDIRDRQETLKELEPSIKEANKHAPVHGQLDPHHVLFADEDRPLRYLGQGKIQRHQTYQQYEEDIEKVYQAAEDEQLVLTEGDAEDSPRIDFTRQSSIKKWLQKYIADDAGIHDLGGDDTFFEAGMDSLRIIRIVRELKRQVKLADDTQLTPHSLSPATVYSHPSLNELSDHLSKKAKSTPQDLDSGYQSANSEETGRSSKLRDMESLLDKYVQKLPVNNQRQTLPVTQGTTVLLTGSTGSLGSYLLNELSNDPNVEHIICLDRTSSAAEKHRETGPKRGLTPLNPERVEFLKANLADPELGLGNEVYERLKKFVTHIIHCQWPVNFNWTLSSFEPSIAGVQNLAVMATNSAHNAFILFVSSVASVGGWKGPEEIPEAPIHDLTVAANMGYGQSKLIAEGLLNKASEISGVRSAICRVGIVAGPIKQELGMWNKSEYIPSIIVSSACLNVFPKTFPSRDHIDWLPVDKLSKILVEILSSASHPSNIQELPEEEVSDPLDRTGAVGTKMYHVVNPQAASWSTDFAPKVLDAYPGSLMQPVPFEDWVERLKASAEEAEDDQNIDIERNPAIRLVDFYSDAIGAKKSQRILQANASTEASKTLRELGPLSRGWLENWMVQWGLKSA